MRIGLDGRPLAEHAGVGHHARNLIRSLVSNNQGDKLVLFLDVNQTVPSFLKEAASVEIRRWPSRRGKIFLPLVYSHWILAGALRKAKLDAFHSLASTIPLAYKKPSVVTIHDLAIYFRPDWFPRGQIFATRVAVPRTLKKVKKIIAVSKTTRDDLVSNFSLPREKITVVYNGVNKLDSPPPDLNLKGKFGINRDFFLFLGTLEPRKNLPGLVKAYAKSPAKIRLHHQLVIAGPEGWGKTKVKLEEIIRRFNLNHEVIFTGRVDDDVKSALLARAKALVWPSFYEGFGLPILEAMQMDTPVITSNVSATAEIAGNAALLVDPTDISDISQAMQKIAEDPNLASDLVSRGRERVKNFSWDKAAKEVMAVYHEVVG